MLNPTEESKVKVSENKSIQVRSLESLKRGRNMDSRWGEDRGGVWGARFSKVFI